MSSDALGYTVTIERRSWRSRHYDTQPFCAMAVRDSDGEVIAMQGATSEGLALASVMRYVNEDRQRTPVTVKLPAGG